MLLFYNAVAEPSNPPLWHTISDAWPRYLLYHIDSSLASISPLLTELRHPGDHKAKARYWGRRSNSNGLRTRDVVRFRLVESATTASSATTTTATTVVAAIRTNATTHGLGGNTGADLDIGFFDNETAFDGTAAGAAVFGSQHPFVIGFGQGVDRDDADAIAVIAAFARAESDSPLGLAGFG